MQYIFVRLNVCVFFRGATVAGGESKINMWLDGTKEMLGVGIERFKNNEHVIKK